MQSMLSFILYLSMVIPHICRPVCYPESASGNTVSEAQAKAELSKAKDGQIGDLLLCLISSVTRQVEIEKI